MHRKHKAMKRVKGSEDRISGLPDTVLSHILSYLRTVESVRTSILSKRWKSVWTYVPFLDLDDSLLYSDNPDKQHSIRSSFIQFLNNVFNLHKTDSLQKLTFKCGEFDSHRVNEWVLSAMRCGVKELDLCNYACGFKLGVPLFVYQDLEALKLGQESVIDIPGEVLLPSLKKLYLDHIEFSDEESCHKLLSGCPVLEYLHIESCVSGNVETLQINAPELKFLLLDSCDVDSVVVDAPYLEVFRCESCYLAKRYSFENLSSLSDAYIDVYMHDCDRSTSELREASCQLVNGIANAKIITFTGHTLEVLSFLDLTALPMFNFLTKLVLGGHSFCSTLLPRVLANTPFLQDLVIDLESLYSRSWDSEWHDPIQVPECLLDSLKSIQIWRFDGQGNVLKFMKYMISNGKVLGELLADRNKEEHMALKTIKEMFGL